MEIIANFFEDYVRHQNLLIPTRSLDGVVCESCANLAVVTGDSEYPIYTPGSATLLKFKNRYFMVCTRHQLDQSDEGRFEHVALAIPRAGKETFCITSSAAKWTSRTLHETDYHEIVAFDFTEACEAYPEVKKRFFEIRTQHPDFREDWVAGITAYGYPSRYVDYNFDDRSINFGRLRVPCRFSSKPDIDPAVHALEPLEPMTGSPDGMSGGPVFFVLFLGAEASLHLVGITVTGSEKALRVVKAGAVLRVLEKFF